MIATLAPPILFVAAVYLAAHAPPLPVRRPKRPRRRAKRRISRDTGNRLIASAIARTTYGPTT